jgi:hypothetical protein
LIVSVADSVGLRVVAALFIENVSDNTPLDGELVAAGAEDMASDVSDKTIIVRELSASGADIEELVAAGAGKTEPADISGGTDKTAMGKDPSTSESDGEDTVSNTFSSEYEDICVPIYKVECAGCKFDWGLPGLGNCWYCPGPRSH